MFVKKFQELIYQRSHKIHNHPFNIALCNGTLPQEKFNYFLVQDRLYLLDFAKALKYTASRLPDTNKQQLFHKLAMSAANEVNLVDLYLKKPTTQMFFQSQPYATLKTPVIENYTNHLLDNAQNAPIEVAVASLVPCFLIYSELGRHMQSKICPNNPYKLWLDSYANDSFLIATNAIVLAAKELNHSLKPAQDACMFKAFIKSVEYEIAFWDCVYGESYEQKLESVDNSPPTYAPLLVSGIQFRSPY